MFHKENEKVEQSMMKAMQAGYFCLFLIEVNPSAADSVGHWMSILSEADTKREEI